MEKGGDAYSSRPSGRQPDQLGRRNTTINPRVDERGDDGRADETSASLVARGAVKRSGRGLDEDDNERRL